MAVTLPQGEDLNEWIACNIADFYKQVRDVNTNPINNSKMSDIDALRICSSTVYSEHVSSDERDFEIYL